MGMERPVEVKRSLNKGPKLSHRKLCEGREDRGSVTIGEPSDSVRGLTRVQYL